MTVKTLPSRAQCTLQNKEGEFVVGSSPETLKIETACEEVTIKGWIQGNKFKCPKFR
jgi:hypothetical protein